MSALPERPVLVGLGWSALAAAFAAGYLVPFKAAAMDVGPARLVLPMMLIAALLSSALEGVGRLRELAFRRGGAWRWGRSTLITALLLGAAAALGNEAVCRSLATLSPGLVSVTLRTQVIFVAFVALLLLGEPVGVRFWTGLAMALVGFVYLQGSLDVSNGFSWAGLLWALVASASFGAMQVIIRRAIHRIDLLKVNTLRLWFSVGLLALVPGRAQNLFHIHGHTWLLAGLAALGGPVLSRLCLMRALRTLPAAHATMALFSAPVFAYLLTGLVLSTWPGPTEILGSLVILVAVALPVTELGRRQNRRHGEPAAG